MDPHFSLAGFVVGVFVGMSGVGSSSLMMPILVLLLGVSPLTAVGTDLAYSMPTNLVGAFFHHRQRTGTKKVVLYLALAGVPAALLGVLTLHSVEAHIGLAALNSDLRHGLGFLLVIVAVIIILTPFIIKKNDPDPFETVERSKWRVMLIGAVVGYLVAITSIGAGSITMTALCLILPMLRIQDIIGSDVAFAAMVIPVAAAGHWAIGNVNWWMTLELLIGSIPGVILGTWLCKKLPTKWLRPVMALAMVYAGLRMIFA
ncbi:MAG TPA: sulfite exporter TauE/SafE family protein [Candidatus Eremiobacteraceae bacterium]|nr:sulfite exporter TauE/SafE family protein [Candidatus Eremiobacteraceae bacterium]